MQIAHLTGFLQDYPIHARKYPVLSAAEIDHFRTELQSSIPPVGIKCPLNFVSGLYLDTFTRLQSEHLSRRFSGLSPDRGVEAESCD
jgi:hypothetical protein